MQIAEHSIAQEPIAPPPARPVATTQEQPPRIGEVWHDGIYAGVSRGENGEPDGHILLLNDKPKRPLAWKAAIKWAESLGNGARLPSRFESALLYANLRNHLDTDRWHWTGTQCAERYAWSQYFDGGGQSYYGKGYEARARAVRRFPL